MKLVATLPLSSPTPLDQVLVSIMVMVYIVMINGNKNTHMNFMKIFLPIPSQ
jgi:hypothetical protein